MNILLENGKFSRDEKGGKGIEWGETGERKNTRMS